MSNSSTPVAPKGHYSGHNPIPTINQFIQNLDKDKADRDRQIDEANKAKAAAEKAQKQGRIPGPYKRPQQQQQQPQQQSSGDAKPHQAHQYGVEGTKKTVTDPTTGREVVIEDVNKEMMENVKNPTVRLLRCFEYLIMKLMSTTVHCAKPEPRTRYSELG
jgi:hypothetical protein